MARFVVETTHGEWAGVIADEVRDAMTGLFFMNHIGVEGDSWGSDEIVLAIAAGEWAIVAMLPEVKAWPDYLSAIYGGDEPFDASPQEREKEK